MRHMFSAFALGLALTAPVVALADGLPERPAIDAALARHDKAEVDSLLYKAGVRVALESAELDAVIGDTMAADGGYDGAAMLYAAAMRRLPPVGFADRREAYRTACMKAMAAHRAKTVTQWRPVDFCKE